MSGCQNLFLYLSSVVIRSHLFGARGCDQMARLFFNIWPFTTVNICPIPILKIAKVGLKCCQILTNRKNCSKILLNFLPKWRNFTKYGHTGAR